MTCSRATDHGLITEQQAHANFYLINRNASLEGNMTKTLHI